MTLRGGVKLQAVSLLQAPLPYKARTTEMPRGSRNAKRAGARALRYDVDNDNNQREKIRRRQEKETTTTGVVTTMVRHCVCDSQYYYPEEEERLTTMTGDRQAQGEGCLYDSTVRKTEIVTTMQDRLQERLNKIKTSSDYIIRQTDKLRLKLLAFFSQSLCYFRGKLLPVLVYTGAAPPARQHQ